MNPTTLPRVSIAVISFNRLHYLRALLESARECIRYPNLEWIVSDGDSFEEGLPEYIRSLDFVDHKLIRRQTHTDAMNQVLEVATGEYLLLLPDDLQFIVRGEWMRDIVELLATREGIGGVCFDAQRRQTIRAHFGHWRYRLPFRRNPVRRRYRTSSGREFVRYGNTKPGLIAAGIMSFAPTEIWRRLGPWRGRPATVADSTGGGETEMLQRYERSGLDLERCMLRLPVAADIVTDPRGTKARVRGNRRYGKYFPPPDGRFYYRVRDEVEVRPLLRGRLAVAFEEIVEPLGFELPLDQQGNLLKQPFVGEGDPFEWVRPEAADAAARTGG